MTSTLLSILLWGNQVDCLFTTSFSIAPDRVFTCSYGHALNLAAADTLKQCKIMKDALETTREITKPINFSPHYRIFRSLKETLPARSTLGIRVLCPTRWTVRAESICNIIANYEALEMTWDEAITGA